MKISERRLRKIIRQTVIEENNKRILRENVMKKLASRPMILFGLMIALSGCTGKSIEPQDTQSPQSQVTWVEDAAEEVTETPETYEDAVKRINSMEGVSAKDKEMLIGHLEFLKAVQKTNKGIGKAVSPMK